MKTVGLIVNPIAGMGGRVGLKGTDGQEIVKKALELGAKPEAPERAIRMLHKMETLRDQIKIFTYSGQMGEDESRECGFEPEIIGSIGSITTSEDTITAARKLADLGVDLLVFVGGDGTARDIYSAIDGRLIVIGVPAGVKIHSAVYANNPQAAGELAVNYLQGRVSRTRDSEVMDIDEEAFRAGRVSAALYGYLKVPFDEQLVQGMKIGRASSEEAAVEEIAQYVVDQMQNDVLYVIGPGSTAKGILKNLQIDTNLLGVDILKNRAIVAQDVSENQLLQAIQGQPAKIVITVIGGQGYLFGRGNQQISASVIREIGKENVIVVATQDKILALRGKPLLVDTGDDAVNLMLKGYIKIITGYREMTVARVD